MSDEFNSDAVTLATELTIAWLGNQNNRVQAEDVPTFLRTMHATLSELSGGAADDGANESEPAPEAHEPAVTVRKSLASKDHIISLIDGKAYKTLKRHLSGHGLTPADYRARYGLKADYPMVAENYAASRREIAKKLGLGRKPGQKSAPKKAAPTS